MYIVLIKNVSQTLKYSLKLKKVHGVTGIEQSHWMNLFIMLNTKLKTTAKNDFKKDFFQLMKNSIFGKTMENFRNYDYKPT